eukprot:gnl/Chilomastix_cuspidata/5785.p1 GENE.gnl/Chilomastix_cuspidata/5785~~gnl/Chilomastix_cuspidata/5785.p1  ORF type:complete len:803 (-),score=131.14 gnl/Chilomastix_cuspidata/5785:137-2545(-)
MRHRAGHAPQCLQAHNERHGSDFSTVSSKPLYLSNSVTSVAAMPSSILFSEHGGRVLQYDPSSGSREKLLSIDAGEITTLFFDSRQLLWVHTDARELSCWDTGVGGAVQAAAAPTRLFQTALNAPGGVQIASSAHGTFVLLAGVGMFFLDCETQRAALVDVPGGDPPHTLVETQGAVAIAAGPRVFLACTSSDVHECVKLGSAVEHLAASGAVLWAATSAGDICLMRRADLDDASLRLVATARTPSGDTRIRCVAALSDTVLLVSGWGGVFAVHAAGEDVVVRPAPFEPSVHARAIVVCEAPNGVHAAVLGTAGRLAVWRAARSVRFQEEPSNTFLVPAEHLRVLRAAVTALCAAADREATPDSAPPLLVCARDILAVARALSDRHELRPSAPGASPLSTDGAPRESSSPEAYSQEKSWSPTDEGDRGAALDVEARAPNEIAVAPGELLSALQDRLLTDRTREPLHPNVRMFLTRVLTAPCVLGFLGSLLPFRGAALLSLAAAALEAPFRAPAGQIMIRTMGSDDAGTALSAVTEDGDARAVVADLLSGAAFYEGVFLLRVCDRIEVVRGLRLCEQGADATDAPTLSPALGLVLEHPLLLAKTVSDAIGCADAGVLALSVPQLVAFPRKAYELLRGEAATPELLMRIASLLPSVAASPGQTEAACLRGDPLAPATVANLCANILAVDTDADKTECVPAQPFATAAARFRAHCDVHACAGASVVFDISFAKAAHTARTQVLHAVALAHLSGIHQAQFPPETEPHLRPVCEAYNRFLGAQGMEHFTKQAQFLDALQAFAQGVGL